MRTQRIILSLAITIGGVAAATPASSQEHRGTWEQQMACTPDVMRLCSDQIPDTDRIVTCLRQNTALLGSSCRAVFESNAQQQAAQQPKMQRRAPQPQTMQWPHPQLQPAAPSPDDDDE